MIVAYIIHPNCDMKSAFFCQFYSGTECVKIVTLRNGGIQLISVLRTIKYEKHSPKVWMVVGVAGSVQAS